VLEEAIKGNAVFLFTFKKTCRECWYELRSLHRWAKYFKSTGQKAKIIALLNRKYGTYPKAVYKAYYPYIDIYDEPKNQNIFGKLKAGTFDMLMYDQCGRHQYHYKHPYSSLVQPYVKLAMENTITHYQTLCGLCNSTSITIPTYRGGSGDVPPTEKLVTEGPALA